MGVGERVKSRIGVGVVTTGTKLPSKAGFNIVAPPLVTEPFIFNIRKF